MHACVRNTELLYNYNGDTQVDLNAQNKEILLLWLLSHGPDLSRLSVLTIYPVYLSIYNFSAKIVQTDGRYRYDWGSENDGWK